MKKRKNRKEGFYTYEAAALLPLFAFFVLVFLLIFRALSFQWGLFATVYQSSAHLALAGDVTIGEKKEAITPISVYAASKALLKKNGVSTGFLSHDLLFIDFAQTEVNEKDIDVRAGYLMPLLAGQRLFGKKGYELGNRICIRRWNGFDPAEGEGDGGIVYVTENGSVYHTSLSCTYIRLSIHTAQVSALGGLRSESGHKYYPCESCGDEISGVFYYTDYGTRAHSSLSCSRLKRTVKTLTREEAVKKYRPCSKCGSGERHGTHDNAKPSSGP